MTYLLAAALLATGEPDFTVTLRDIEPARVLAATGARVPAWARLALAGKVGRVVLRVRGRAFDLEASDVRTAGRPVVRAWAVGDLKAMTLRAKVYALGGVAEYSGRLPTGE